MCERIVDKMLTGGCAIPSELEELVLEYWGIAEIVGELVSYPTHLMERENALYDQLVELVAKLPVC